jgi:hypothetical protein
MKNRIINGAMQIWQRGTTSTAIGYQTADRWSFYADSSRTVAQSTDVPSGFTYSASLSGTGSTGFTQKIESVNTIGLVGNSITISFWLKQTTGAGTNAIGLSLYYATASDNWNASTQISTTQTFTTTTGWAQYSATFSSLPSGSANGLQVTISTTSGSAVVFLLTGVQLEVGSSATSFDYRQYTTELQLCQRYYYVNASGATDSVMCPGYYLTSSNAAGIIPYPVTMRITPSLSSTSGTNYYKTSTDDLFNSLSIAYGTNQTMLVFNNTETSGTAGYSIHMRTNSSSATVAFSAEL